jgi:hypothetical protein
MMYPTKIVKHRFVSGVVSLMSSPVYSVGVATSETIAA